MKLNDIIQEIREEYENSKSPQVPGGLVSGALIDHIFDRMDRRIENLEKLVLFFLDKEGPKKDEQT